MRRLAAVLLVATAGLLVIGTNAESKHGASTPGEESSNGESSEEGHAGTGEEAESGAEGEGGHDERGEEETILGIDAESPAATAVAVVVSLALAAGLWWDPRRWLVTAAVVAALSFAAFDVTEVVRQLDESNTGIAVLAGVIAVGHAAAATLSAASQRKRSTPAG